MKPMLSYPGGKQRMATKLLELIPEHSVYVEPFAGGAALLFSKPVKEVSNNDRYREVLNDLNGDVVNFYKVMTSPVDGPVAVERIKNTLYSEQVFKEAQRSLDMDPISRAVNFYVLSQQSFAHQFAYNKDGSFSIKGWARAKYGRNNAATWVNKLEALPEKLARLQGVFVSHGTFEKCIADWDCKDAFFYCDPPYPNTGVTYKNAFGVSDLQKLVDQLATIQGQFMLSCYPVPELKVPENWRVVDFQARMSTAGQTKNMSRVNTDTRRVERVYLSPER